MALGDSFSKRNRYTGTAKEISIREDAPEGLRFSVLETARELGWGPSSLRDVVCRVLRVRPDPNNWSDSNVWGEVQALVYDADWFRVYDVIEELHTTIEKHDQSHGGNDAERFADELNGYLVEEGIGWQISGGQVVARGGEGSRRPARRNQRFTGAANDSLKRSHIHNALQALSARPLPNLSGAIYHGMGALEAVARNVTREEKATLGELLKRNPGLLPKPLDNALEKVWGYASNEARHVEEGRNPSREEAELVVGLAAVVATYLANKPTAN